MRPTPLLRLLFALPVLGWSGWLLWAAFERWQFKIFCSLACPLFMPPELANDLRRAMNWQLPLLMACLPIAVLGAGWLLRRFSAR